MAVHFSTVTNLFHLLELSVISQHILNHAVSNWTQAKQLAVLDGLQWPHSHKAGHGPIKMVKIFNQSELKSAIHLINSYQRWKVQVHKVQFEYSGNLFDRVSLIGDCCALNMFLESLVSPHLPTPHHDEAW